MTQDGNDTTPLTGETSSSSMPQPTSVPVMRQRPGIVLLIAVLFFVGAVCEFSTTFKGDGFSIVYPVVKTVTFIFGLADSLVGVGLLLGWPAARVGAIIVIILRFCAMIPLGSLEYSILATDPTNSLFTDLYFFLIFVSTAIYYGVLIYFLTRSAVKNYCSR